MVKQDINDLAKKLSDNYRKQGVFETTIKMPGREKIIDIINELKRIMFPGYFGTENTAYVSLESFAGNTLAGIYEKMFQQVKIAYSHKEKMMDMKGIEQMAEKTVLQFMEKIPYIQQLLLKDVEAEYKGDPAANSREEIIFSYPGIFAIFVYRIAHELYLLDVPFIPRMMTEYAHGNTGIDINPGAQIGEYFFIDHGTGIVIGETTLIGNYVKLYQGVTLGALSPQKGQELFGIKRHPTIENNVVVYANSTILGGETIIGENSVIAGNSFITESIPANTRVSTIKPELQYKSNSF